MTRRLSHACPIVLALVACTPTEAPTDTGAAPIAPLSPDEEHYGTTYEQLTLDWYAWTVEQPVTNNPAFDETGEDCGVGQTGDVWMLAGSFTSPTVSRTCTVPADKAIFFPMINYYGCQQLYEAYGLEFILDDEIAWMTALGDYVSELHASVDGQLLADPFRYQIGPTQFSVDLPEEDNFLQHFGLEIKGTMDPCVTSGYWMLLEPLPAGEHTVNFGGTFDWATEDSADDFNNDNTYALTVE